MEEHANRLYLSGELSDLPAFSHECCGVSFYLFQLSVLRKSGVADVLPVLCEESRLPPELVVGDALTVTGQLRAYNRHTALGNRLHILAFAKRVGAEEAPHDNSVVIIGRIVKPPVYRSTPLGREIADLLVAAPRGFGKSDFLPVIAWGRNARIAQYWQPGDCVSVEGRLQSRVYLKRMPDGEERSMLAYEISATTIARM